MDPKKSPETKINTEYIYFLNCLVNYKTDLITKNVFVLNPTLHRFKEEDNLLVCSQGNIFRYNFLIRVITIFNFKLDYN